jgi:hypothetical protein
MNILLIQTSIEQASSFNIYLQNIYQIAQIIGTLLILIYVICTYFTFKQIKKQTDFQQDAYLRIDHKIKQNLFDDPRSSVQLASGQTVKIFSKGFETNFTKKYIKTELSTKIKNVLKPIFKLDDNLYEGNYYSICLTNYGNTEVKEINLKLNIDVRFSQELVEKRMLKNFFHDKIDIKIEEIVGRNGNSITIPLISTASFPAFKISVIGSYIDVRCKEYKIAETVYSGQNPHFDKLPE